MIVNHERSSWQPYTDNGTFYGYRIVQQPVGFLLTSFSFLMGTWSKGVREIIKNGENHIPRHRGALLLFQIFTSCIAKINRADACMSLASIMDFRAWKSLQKARQPLVEKKNCFKEAFQLSQEIVESMPEKLTQESIQFGLRELRERVDSLLLERGYRLVDKSVTLSADERNFLQIPESSPQPNLDKLDCVGYALLKLKEPRARHWILHGPPAFEYQEPIHLLQQWGYELVTTPQNGDLVLYFNDSIKERGLKVMHGAIFINPNRLLMKLSVFEGIYECALDQTRVFYGDIVMFFRKK